MFLARPVCPRSKLGSLYAVLGYSEPTTFHRLLSTRLLNYPSFKFHNICPMLFNFSSPHAKVFRSLCPLAISSVTTNPSPDRHRDTPDRHSETLDRYSDSPWQCPSKENSQLRALWPFSAWSRPNSLHAVKAGFNIIPKSSPGPTQKNAGVISRLSSPITRMAVLSRKGLSHICHWWSGFC